MVRGPSFSALRDHPDAVRRGNFRRAIRPATPGAFRRPSRCVGGLGVRGVGPSTRADGPARLPERARRFERRSGRVPGDVPRTGPACSIDSQAGVGRKLALRRRQSRGGEGACERGSPTLGRAARGIEGRDGGRVSRRRRSGSVGLRPGRAGGSPSAAGEVPRRGGALLLGGPDARAGRQSARHPPRYGAEPRGPGPGPPSPTPDPTRTDARRP